jgi:Ca2+-binding EF-hand superfamily protein
MADDSLAASPAAAPAAKERAEISDDAARQVLLLHCMQLLSMLKPEVRARQAVNEAVPECTTHEPDLSLSGCKLQDGPRVEILKTDDVRHALTRLGESAAMVEKAGDMLERLFPSKALSYREFTLFLRFGKVKSPGELLRKLGVPKKRRSKPEVPLDQTLVMLYEQGTKSASPRVDNRVHIKGPTARLPAVTLSGPRPDSKQVPSIVQDVYFPKSPTAASREAIDSSSYSSTPGTELTPASHLLSKSAPTLPTITSGRTPDAVRVKSRSTAWMAPPISPAPAPAPAPAEASSPTPTGGFSFGKAVRFKSKSPRVRLAALMNAPPSPVSPAARSSPSRFGQKRAEASPEAVMLIEHLRNQMRERKVKVSDMMAQLDADGDGQLDRNELREGMRKLFEGKEAEGGAPVSVTDEILEKVLDVFDSDRSGTVDAGEFNRAMWSSQRLLTKLNRTGGAGIFNVRGENRRSLRVSTEDLDQIGSRLIMEVVPHVALLINSDGSKRDLPAEERPKEDGQPSDHERLRKRLCQEMCRHFQETIRYLVSAQSGGFEAVRRKDFQIGMSKLYGMRPVDVGDVGAQMLRLATLALFDSWDIAHLGELDLIELMKVLRHGGSVQMPKGAPRDVIFQAEIASHELKARRTKQTAISAAKQALHGFVARTRNEQLHIRAERVAPVQLESLLSTMLQESGSLIDLFLRWDTDGDGTIGLEEFATAIMYLGFTFSKEVCTELFRFFDKDGSGTVNLEEIEATIKWGKERKPRMRALLPGWRQLSLDIDVNGQSQLVTRGAEQPHLLDQRTGHVGIRARHALRHL